MEPLNFRLNVDGLEERMVMSVTPSQVVAAYTNAMQNIHDVQELSRTIGDPRTTRDIQFLASHLQPLADQNRADAAVLGEYLAQLRSEFAANPALQTALGPFAGGIGYAQFYALVTADFADLYSVGFGASPRVPPPPPPPTDTPPNFGAVPTPPGTSTSNPPGSTLPFSLGDPAWQNLSNGVRIWDVKTGSGTAVKLNDQISINYTGYLTDGTVFDSNTNPSSPLKTPLNAQNLIQGFVNGLVGMQPGGVRRIDIPASLAYGSQGQGSVPPNAELVFEVTLVSSP